jgi:hypothetical protein
MSNCTMSRNKTMRLIAIGVMSLFFPLVVLAQSYTFGPNSRVSDDPPGLSFHSTYSPGQHLIAARGDTVYLVWRDDRGGDSHVYFARSNNRGRGFLPNIRVDSIPGCAGILPSLAVDDNGGIHVCYLNYNTSDHAFVYYARSTNGGQSFLPPVRACDSTLEHEYGRPSIAVSRSGRDVHVVRSQLSHGPVTPTQIYLARSIDGGATFVSPDARVSSDTAIDMQDPCIALFRDSIVLVAWTGQFYAPYPDIRFARSTDGGVTFSTNVLLIDTVNDRHAHDFSTIGVDGIGRVYVVWSGTGNGLGMSISQDTGRTIGHGQEMPVGYWGGYPSLHVSLDGRLYLAWYTWTGGYYYNDVRFAFSPDGGATFLSPVNPSDGPDSTDEVSPTVTANHDGDVFMAWEDDRHHPTGFNHDVYFASGVMSGIEERPSAMAAQFDCTVMPNPTNGMTRITYSLPEANVTRVVVYDVAGKSVEMLHDEFDQPGAHSLSWNARDRSGSMLPAGVYLVRIAVKTGSISRKLLLTRE